MGLRCEYLIDVTQALCVCACVCLVLQSDMGRQGGEHTHVADEGREVCVCVYLD